MGGPRDAEVRRVLDERARALARVEAESEPEGETVGLVVCSLERERCGVELSMVLEIEPLEGLTAVPGLGGDWAGVVNLRGVVFPVLALARHLGLAETAGERGELLVVAGSGLEVALLVDAVVEIRQERRDAIRPLSGEGPAARLECFSGVTPDMVSMIDLEALLSSPALVVDQEAA